MPTAHLPHGLLEQLQQVDVVRLGAEVALEDDKYLRAWHAESAHCPCASTAPKARQPEAAAFSRCRCCCLCCCPAHLAEEAARVVEGDESDCGALVPARLPAARDGSVHHVVCHEEECLQPLQAPACDSGQAGLALGRRGAPHGKHRVHDAQAAIQLAPCE